MITSFLIAFSSIVLFVMWILICNERTLAQRIDIIPSANDTDFWKKLDVFKSVPYTSHWIALICFQDANKLYKETE